MSTATLVVGTAGHVDHGKTSLVRMLTGVELDTQPDEQARGITIALGFTPLELPDGSRVALVDVPGHERLVRTMIAGATGLDAVLLCVSAQDGAMPQTREHLAILQLLGLRDGLVVLTKSDLVDEELLELAEEEIAELVEGTFLEGKPIIAVSSVTGDGRDELLAAMSRLSRESPTAEGPFRLPVDRAFSRPGFGTVVTGTAWSGRLAEGETVRLLPGGGTARVRGLQIHGEAASSARAGSRVAVNLAGVDVDEVSRGVVIVTGSVPVTSMIDVKLDLLEDAPLLEDGASVRFLLGTSEAVGHLHLAEEADVLDPGGSYWAQVRLDKPVTALPGDRFVLRRTSPLETLGGGVVVDPWAPRLRRKRRVQHGKEAARLLAGEQVVWLERAGEAGLAPGEWTERGGDPQVGDILAGRRFAATVVARLKGVLLEALRAFHVEHPLARGAGRRELRRGRLGHLPDRVFDGLVERLVNADLVILEGNALHLPDFAVHLSAADRKVRDRLVAAVAETGLAGLAPKKLGELFPGDAVPALLHLLEHDGTLSQVSGLGWVATESLRGLETQIRNFFGSNPRLGPADFKALTGLSRKSAIPLLEWLDHRGFTRRTGDGRIPGPALASTGD